MIANLRTLTLADWFSLLSIGALLSGAVLFFYRKVARPIWRYLAKKKKWFTDAINSIAEIRKEMFPNGGTSMRDRVEQTAQRVNQTAQIVTEMRSDTAMSVAQNRLLAEQVDVGIFEGDVEGSVVWANRALRQMTGLKLEQIVGSGWFNAVHNDDKRRIETDWMLATGHRTLYIGMFRFVHVGTTAETAVQCEASPVIADGGIVSGWLAQFRTQRGIRT